MAAPTSLRDTLVKRFTPRTVSDSQLATNTGPGACAQLVNLVPELSTKDMWAPRPAVVLKAQLSANPAFTIPGPIAVFKVVGDIAYGLAADLGIGVDKPFAFNLLTNAWLTVTNSGVPLNPVIQPFTGDWSPFPPNMDLCGVNLVVCHPGWATTAPTNSFGWLDISTPTAPVWHTGNTAAGSAFSFTNIPWWVVQFNGRAYFGNNPAGAQPGAVFTDVLTLKVTNANQILTFGDNQLLTAAGAMPLSNQLGGIIQSLMVFKGTSNIFQVTGDATTSNLTVNALNIATGTTSPRTIVRTPVGLAFLSPAGMRYIDFNARISDPVGLAGEGVVVPFTKQFFPGRTCASCDGVTFRICFVSAQQGGNRTGYSEYWYNIPRRVWSGPHSYPSEQQDIWNGQFLISSAPQFNISTNLFLSATSPISTSTYIENSIQMTFSMQSVLMEDSGQMAEQELAELAVVGGANSNTPIAVTMITPDGATIVNASVTFSTPGPRMYRVDFNKPAVFNNTQLQLTGNCAAGLLIGDTWLRLRVFGYLGRIDTTF